MDPFAALLVRRGSRAAVPASEQDADCAGHPCQRFHLCHEARRDSPWRRWQRRGLVDNDLGRSPPKRFVPRHASSEHPRHSTVDVRESCPVRLQEQTVSRCHRQERDRDERGCERRRDEHICLVSSALATLSARSTPPRASNASAARSQPPRSRRAFPPEHRQRHGAPEAISRSRPALSGSGAPSEMRPGTMSRTSAARSAASDRLIVRRAPRSRSRFKTRRSMGTESRNRSKFRGDVSQRQFSSGPPPKREGGRRPRTGRAPRSIR